MNRSVSSSKKEDTETSSPRLSSYSTVQQESSQENDQENDQENAQECSGVDKMNISQAESREEANLNKKNDNYERGFRDRDSFSFSEGNSSSNSASSYAGSGDIGQRPPGEFVPSEYLTDAFLNSLDLTELDRAIVVQTKTSALINAKTTEVERLRLEATSRLATLKQLFQDGARHLRQTEKDLTWAGKRVKTLHAKMKINHPIEYNKAITKICERDNIDF